MASRPVPDAQFPGLTVQVSVTRVHFWNNVSSQGKTHVDEAVRIVCGRELANYFYERGSSREAAERKKGVGLRVRVCVHACQYACVNLCACLCVYSGTGYPFVISQRQIPNPLCRYMQTDFKIFLSIKQGPMQRRSNTTWRTC